MKLNQIYATNESENVGNTIKIFHFLLLIIKMNTIMSLGR